LASPGPEVGRGYDERYDELQMKRFLGLFLYNPEKTCPLCGSAHLHRSKRGRRLEFWVLLLVPVRPYRCGKCWQRFYGPKKFASARNPGEVSEPLDDQTLAPGSRSEPPGR
jgi:hypothetical protein